MPDDTEVPPALLRQLQPWDVRPRPDGGIDIFAAAAGVSAVLAFTRDEARTMARAVLYMTDAEIAAG